MNPPVPDPIDIRINAEVNKITSNLYLFNRYTIFLTLLTNAPSIFIALVNLVGRPEDFNEGRRMTIKFISWIIIPLIIILLQPLLELLLLKSKDKLLLNLALALLSMGVLIYFFFFYANV